MRVGTWRWKLADRVATALTAILLVGMAFAAIVFSLALVWMQARAFL
jgi:hypothetical protein